MSALEVVKLWKYYGDYPALRSVSLEVEEGACCALLGTVMGRGRLPYYGFSPDSRPFREGTVRIFGAAPRSEMARLRAGFLGHGIGVYEDLTARENLQFFSRITKAGSRTVDHWLERVDLARVSDLPVRQFSRGMRQRLAVARAFVHEPKLLVLDEPFTALDDRAITMLSELLREAQVGGATVILSTHQLREALAIATDVALMENGTLRFRGERTSEMLDDPGLLYRLHSQDARS